MVSFTDSTLTRHFHRYLQGMLLQTSTHSLSRFIMAHATTNHLPHPSDRLRTWSSQPSFMSWLLAVSDKALLRDLREFMFTKFCERHRKSSEATHQKFTNKSWIFEWTHSVPVKHGNGEYLGQYMSDDMIQEADLLFGALRPIIVVVSGILYFSEWFIITFYHLVHEMVGQIEACMIYEVQHIHSLPMPMPMVFRQFN